MGHPDPFERHSFVFSPCIGLSNHIAFKWPAMMLAYENSNAKLLCLEFIFLPVSNEV